MQRIIAVRYKDYTGQIQTECVEFTALSESHAQFILQANREYAERQRGKENVIEVTLKKAPSS